jgi:hypothetical protein
MSKGWRARYAQEVVPNAKAGWYNASALQSGLERHICSGLLGALIFGLEFICHAEASLVSRISSFHERPSRAG